MAFAAEMATVTQAFQDIGDILLLQRLDPVLENNHTKLRISAISEILSYVWLNEDVQEYAAPDPSYTDISTFIRQRNTELATRKIYVETARAVVFEVNEIAKTLPNTTPLADRRRESAQQLSAAYGGLDILSFYDPVTNRVDYDVAVAVLTSFTNTANVGLLHNKAAKIHKQLNLQRTKQGYPEITCAKDFMAIYRFKTTEIVNKLLDAYRNGKRAMLKDSILSAKLAEVLSSLIPTIGNNPPLQNKYIALAEFPNYAKKVHSGNLAQNLQAISQELVTRMKSFETTSIQNAKRLLSQIKASNGNLYFMRVAATLNTKKLGDRYAEYNDEWSDELVKEVKNLLKDPLNPYVCDYCRNLHGQIRHASFYLVSPKDMPPSHPHCRCKLYPINGDYIAKLQQQGIAVDTNVAVTGVVLDKRDMKKYAKKFMQTSRQPKGKTSWLNPVIVGSVLVLSALAGIYAVRRLSYKPSLPKSEPSYTPIEIKPIQREPIPVSRWLQETPKFVDTANSSVVNVNTTDLSNNIRAAKARLLDIFNGDKYDEILYNLRITSLDAFTYLAERIKPYADILNSIKNGETISQESLDAIINNNNLRVIEAALSDGDEHSVLLNKFIQRVLPKVDVYDNLSDDVKRKILQDVQDLVESNRLTLRGNERAYYSGIDNFPFAATHIISRRAIEELYNKVKPSSQIPDSGQLSSLPLRISTAKSAQELIALSEELYGALYNLRLLDNFFADYLSEIYRFIPDTKRRARIKNIRDLFKYRLLDVSSPLKGGGIPNYGRITYIETRNRLIAIIQNSINALSSKIQTLLSGGAGTSL